MSFALTKGVDDEDATEFAYVACAYACVASESQALNAMHVNGLQGEYFFNNVTFILHQLLLHFKYY